jgi:hypothetical protein
MTTRNLKGNIFLYTSPENTSPSRKFLKRQKQIESLLSQKTTLLSDIKECAWSGIPFGK